MGCLYLAILRVFESISKVLTHKIYELNFTRGEHPCLSNSGQVKKSHLHPRKEIPKEEFYIGDRKVWVIVKEKKINKRNTSSLPSLVNKELSRDALN